jgi:PAS domain S-box-containing protein
MDVFSNFSIIRRVLLIALSLVLTGYLVFLLYSQYRYQSELQEYYLSRLLEDTEKRATAVSYFFSERMNDMVMLAECRELSVYFENLALGMSMEYGLSASLMDAENSFRKFSEKRELAGKKIFSRVLFLDSSGQKLIDVYEREAARSAERKGYWNRFVTKKGRTPVFFAEGQGNDSIIVLSLPYLFKGRYKGQIIARISPELVFRQFITESDAHGMHSETALLFRRHYLYTSDESQWAIPLDQLPPSENLHKKEDYHFIVTDKKTGSRKMNAYSTRVGDTPFSLVTFIPETDHSLVNSPELVMIITGGIGVIILFGAFIIIRTTMSNIILNTRLGEISIREKVIAEKNRSLRKLTAALEQSANSVVITDRDGVIEYVNPYFTQLTGYAREEASGKFLSMLNTDTESEETYEGMWQAVTSGEQWSGELLMRKKTGELYWEFVSISPVKNDDGEIISCVAIRQDVTERKLAEKKIIKLNAELEQRVQERTAELKRANQELWAQIAEKQKIEEQLLRTRQLESLGILAGGIAHDFNNLLTAILGNASLAKMYADPGDKIHAKLEEVEKASARARDLTQQLLTFSKGGAPVKKVTSIADVIRDSSQFTLRGSKSRCELSITEELWPVEVDEGQISQVIGNLSINADQAMPEGGVVGIRAENVNLGKCEVATLQPGRYVRISITDSGIGIPKDHLSKIFTPYFTTKQKGNGLGLATSYSIVIRHGGLITVESEIGTGTTFHIYLPASEKEFRKIEKPAMTTIAGNGKILVMDDEEYIRNTAGEMLTSVGYMVGFANDGTEAIDLFIRAKESGDPYDVIIMDLTIPGGMGGMETIQKLLEIAPDVKAIVSSGYANVPIMSVFREYGFKGVIAKPYRTEELCKAVRNVILGNG